MRSAPTGRTGGGRSRDGQDYLQPRVPFMLAGQGPKSFAASKVERTGDVLTVSFAGCPSQVKAKVAVRPRYFTLTVTGVQGGALDWLQLANLRVKIQKHVGALVNAAWDERFAVGVLACNDHADCGSHGVPTARAYREFGIEGAKVALVAVPTHGPDPSSKLLDAIEVVELEQGLPRPDHRRRVDQAGPAAVCVLPDDRRHQSQNADQVVQFAKGGFGCVELMWFHSTPTYEPEPSLFPGGLAGLKKVTDKIHAARLQVGMHCMQGMVGWGAKDDPYLTPNADPRLLQDRHATLVLPLDAKAKAIAVNEPLTDWPEQGDLYVEGEIVHYVNRTAGGFADCQRGLYGTSVKEHRERTAPRASGELLPDLGLLGV